MKVVVSDTSAISNLLSIGRIELLRQVRVPTRRRSDSGRTQDKLILLQRGSEATRSKSCR